jgi:hypothetical protein
MLPTTRWNRQVDLLGYPIPKAAGCWLARLQWDSKY